jgi:hypothetical protein
VPAGGRFADMVDRLTRLVGIFEGLDFGRNRAEGDDLLGDVYEYLMHHFATDSGKTRALKQGMMQALLAGPAAGADARFRGV